MVALYCTGDVHLGDRTYDYGDGVVVNHNGFVNANTALATAVERFGGASEVVVAGSSAGSASAALYGGLAADLFGDASVAVVADASGAYPSDPGINAYIGGLWGTTRVVPDWPVNEGVTAAEYGLPELFIRAGAHAPRVRFARFDNAFDGVQEFFAGLAGFDPSNMDQLMYQNEALIEAAGVNQASYMAPGRDHTILYRDILYTLEVEGVAFLDWLTAFLGGVGRRLVVGGLREDVRGDGVDVEPERAAGVVDAEVGGVSSRQRPDDAVGVLRRGRGVGGHAPRCVLRAGDARRPRHQRQQLGDVGHLDGHRAVGGAAGVRGRDGHLVAGLGLVVEGGLGSELARRCDDVEGCRVGAAECVGDRAASLGGVCADADARPENTTNNTDKASSPDHSEGTRLAEPPLPC